MKCAVESSAGHVALHTTQCPTGCAIITTDEARQLSADLAAGASRAEVAAKDELLKVMDRIARHAEHWAGIGLTDRDRLFAMAEIADLAREAARYARGET